MGAALWSPADWTLLTVRGAAHVTPRRPPPASSSTSCPRYQRALPLRAFLSIEDVEELIAFFETELGGRLQARLPGLMLLSVKNEPGAEGREQLEQVLEPFTPVERARMGSMLNGQGLPGLGIAMFASYARTVIAVGTEVNQGR